MDEDKLIKQIKLLYPDLISNVDNDRADDILKLYLDNANSIVQTYNPPKEINDRLIMLLACSNFNNYYVDDSTSIKVGQINLGYAPNSDNPWLDEFNLLLQKYGLNSSIEGF